MKEFAVLCFFTGMFFIALCITLLFSFNWLFNYFFCIIMIAVISQRRDWRVMCDCSVLDGYRFMCLLSESWISVTSHWFSWMRSFLGVEGWMWALVLGREATCCSSSVTWTSSSLPTSWTHAVWMPSLVREERNIYIYSTYRAEPIWPFGHVKMALL